MQQRDAQQNATQHICSHSMMQTTATIRHIVDQLAATGRTARLTTPTLTVDLVLQRGQHRQHITDKRRHARHPPSIPAARLAPTGKILVVDAIVAMDLELGEAIADDRKCLGPALMLTTGKGGDQQHHGLGRNDLWVGPLPVVVANVTGTTVGSTV
ncbi:hypothetical protein BCR44DRAFT_1296285 [Catenaria anguillulae PL171]|uniref:Uncharacterized protein n=1 Tax=Catenaria anguillulae PL171 TaxID=765915 RepID=A0A1Y2HVL9_9FUNG|nr:hypothetical protein BCR44DRAFT_1296285 [Catenaria anguillulae PL171]